MSTHREREHVYVGTCWCGESEEPAPAAALVERATPDGFEPAMGPRGPITEWRDGEERDIVTPPDWEGDLATEHPNRCKLRDGLLWADTQRPAWRCHKREGHDGPCSSHNDCGVMNGGVVCGKLPGHVGPHSWQQFISPAVADRATAPAPQVDHDRLVKQCLEISILLADAGIEACPLPEGVRRLIAQRDVPANLIVTWRTRAVGIAAKRNIGSHDQRTESNARDRGLGYGYEDCADELEAALRSVPSGREQEKP